MKAAFFLFLAVAYSIAIFATAAAQELTQTFVAPEGYIIKLPPGWIEAGKDELAALEKLVLEGAPNAKLGAPRNQVVHLYRQDTDTNLFGDPRIMVAFCRVGKLPEEVFKDFKVCMQKRLKRSPIPHSNLTSGTHLQKSAPRCTTRKDIFCRLHHRTKQKARS